MTELHPPAELYAAGPTKAPAHAYLAHPGLLDSDKHVFTLRPFTARQTHRETVLAVVNVQDQSGAITLYPPNARIPERAAAIFAYEVFP